MNIELIREITAGWEHERAKIQLTLGKLINILEAMPASTPVANLTNGCSYRGYYCDFAFELCSGTRSAKELLDECKSAIGKVFDGYKGGEYVMDEHTPVWVAPYGTCGPKLMAVYPGGKIETSE